MSKKAQRRIVWIVLFAIIFSIFGYKVDEYNMEKNPAISKNEWNAMVAEAFGKESEYTRKGKNDVDGAYIAKTLMDVFDKERLSILSGDDDYEDSVEFAVENGIIARSQLNAPFSKSAAKRALSVAIDLYYSEKMYPDYADITYKENVSDTKDWDILTVDEETVGNNYVDADAPLNKVTVGSKEAVPEVGQILLFQDEYGISKARKVIAFAENGDGIYDLDLCVVEDISEIAEKISFSGSGDFSYITGEGKTAKADVHEANSEMPRIQTSACASSGVTPVLAFWDKVEQWNDEIFGVSFNEGTKSRDIEVGVACSIDHSDTYELKTTVAIDDVKTEFGINSKGMVSGGITVGDGPTLEMEEAEDEEEDDGKASGEAKGTISGSIKLQNFRVSTKGFYVTTDMIDDDNYFEIMVDTDVVYDLTLSGEVEGKYKLGALKCPIPITAGMVSIDVVPYLVVSAEGKISLTWTLEGVHTGVNVSVAQGIQTTHDIRKVDFDPSFEVKASAGVGGEVALKFCGLDLIDPGFTINVVTLGMSSCSNNDGYLNYPPCVDVELRGVDLELEVCYGSDSVAYTILKVIGLDSKLKFQLIDSEKTPIFSMKTHMETELDGTIHFEDECTHVLEDSFDSLLEDAVESSSDKIQNAANSWVEKKVDNFLMDSCQGCY